MRRSIPWLAASAIILAGCGPKDEPPPSPPRSAVQQRTVDSTIGASALPGAGGVRGALSAQDSARARQAALDSLARTP